MSTKKTTKKPLAKRTAKKAAPAKKAPAKAPAKTSKKPKGAAPKARRAKKTPEPSRFVWDPKVTKDRDMAREVYNIFRKKHFLASRLDASGLKGDEMKTFDPYAGAMVFHPAPNRYGHIANDSAV